MTSKNFDRLVEQLPDLEEFLKRDEIKIIPLPRNSKAPKTKGWNSKEYSLDEIQNHKGNFGMLIGYGNQKNGMSIGCLDIDGLTIDTEDEEKKAEIKQLTKELIYEDLKDLPNTLQVRTQSGGYHLYAWTRNTNKSTSETSNSLYFPDDFEIDELAGKCLNNAIEIFTQEGKKQTVLPTSTFFNKDSKQVTRYDVISKINNFSDVEVLDDINETVIEHLTSKGYTHKEKQKIEPEAEPKNNQKHNTDKHGLRQLEERQVKQVVKLLSPVFKNELNQLNKKHTAAMYIGGYFSYHISKDAAVKITDGIIKQVGNVFDDADQFKYTVLQNYDTQTKEKGGLPKLCDLLSTAKNFNVRKFSDKINSICNSYFKKEKVGEVLINDKKVQIYLYEDKEEKWLRYNQIFNNIDMEIYLGEKIGIFKGSKDDHEIIRFEFKNNKGIFKIAKQELENIEYYLATALKDDKFRMPKFFTPSIMNSLNNLPGYATAPKELSKAAELKELFVTRNKENYARKELGNYLYQNGMILRRGLNKPYMLNKNTNGYDSVEIDDILEYLYGTDDFQLNSIHTNDIQTALGFISERAKPNYNIVKFNNCLYDIRNFEILETPEKPILTLTEVQYNYNPNAKGDLIVEFLKSSLYQHGDSEEKLQDRIIAFYEFVGYLLTPGNKKNAWFIISGIGGAGKGVATRLIISIFGADKVGDLKLQELTPDNRFATSHLESKQVNIVRDSPKKPIKDTGILKSITGYDDIAIEPKGKDKYILPKEEVPDMITVCNNIPIFEEGFDESLLQRAIIFEFLNKFRNTSAENSNLEEEILANTEEMEYLIYQSIEAYKKMVESGKDFRARVDEQKTMQLLGKHTDPISYILPKLVKYNPMAEEDGEEYILPRTLNKLILFVAEKKGLNITGLNKNGLITDKNLMKAIRSEFGFDNDYNSIRTNYQNPENGYKWEVIRVLPDLCKTPEYEEYLLEMEEEEEV